jgi:hypothetical protein
MTPLILALAVARRFASQLGAFRGAGGSNPPGRSCD